MIPLTEILDSRVDSTSWPVLKLLDTEFSATYAGGSMLVVFAHTELVPPQLDDEAALSTEPSASERTTACTSDRIATATSSAVGGGVVVVVVVADKPIIPGKPGSVFWPC